MSEKPQNKVRELRNTFYDKEVGLGTTSATLTIIGGGVLGAGLMLLAWPVAGTLGPLGAVLTIIAIGVYEYGPYKFNRPTSRMLAAWLLALLLTNFVIGLPSALYTIGALIVALFWVNELRTRQGP